MKQTENDVPKYDAGPDGNAHAVHGVEKSLKINETQETKQ